jgi:hypothetical protein
MNGWRRKRMSGLRKEENEWTGGKRMSGGRKRMSGGGERMNGGSKRMC